VIPDALGSSYSEGGERKSRKKQHVGERGVYRGREQWIYGGAADGERERRERCCIRVAAASGPDGRGGAALDGPDLVTPNELYGPFWEWTLVFT
jgi:hypothetical protein